MCCNESRKTAINRQNNKNTGCFSEFLDAVGIGYGVHLRKNNFEWKGGETQVQDMDAVYRQHAQTVFKYLMSLTHDADLAEELTQETFFKALKKVDDFRGECDLRIWLCQISKNIYYDYLKKNKKYGKC